MTSRPSRTAWLPPRRPNTKVDGGGGGSDDDDHDDSAAAAAAADNEKEEEEITATDSNNTMSSSNIQQTVSPGYQLLAVRAVGVDVEGTAYDSLPIGKARMVCDAQVCTSKRVRMCTWRRVRECPACVRVCVVAKREASEASRRAQLLRLRHGGADRNELIEMGLPGDASGRTTCTLLLCLESF